MDNLVAITESGERVNLGKFQTVSSYTASTACYSCGKVAQKLVVLDPHKCGLTHYSHWYVCDACLDVRPVFTALLCMVADSYGKCYNNRRVATKLQSLWGYLREKRPKFKEPFSVKIEKEYNLLDKNAGGQYNNYSFQDTSYIVYNPSTATSNTTATYTVYYDVVNGRWYQR